MITVYFLKPKIEAGNKAVHVTLLRKKNCLRMNKDSLRYSGPLECNSLSGQVNFLSLTPLHRLMT